ncbi:hypothetical protein P7K49_033547 [Saguinus oedipus]|uniref:Uncharacterized protein n=1 Tax=Saguinus oedipus TaxID=9490 RepID=A0ABQ9TSX9_SAGOE|nr:hypothetical protein P7K49_033547 [Saguinus oedipus]
MADQNLEKLKTESERLEQHTQKVTSPVGSSLQLMHKRNASASPTTDQGLEPQTLGQVTRGGNELGGLAGGAEVPSSSSDAVVRGLFVPQRARLRQRRG